MLPLRHVTLLFFALTLGVFVFIYFRDSRVEAFKTESLSAILSAENSAFKIGQRIKSAGCYPAGILPDAECTPGAVFSDSALERICVPGYTKTVRNVPLNLRKSVFAEYGISYPQPRGDYEVDHLIPLALGGSNSISNLWPEAAEPVPGFREKDIVEIYLYQEVCAGRVDLNIAQAQIAKDWFTIYKNIGTDRIQQIQSRYRSWSN